MKGIVETRFLFVWKCKKNSFSLHFARLFVTFTLSFLNLLASLYSEMKENRIMGTLVIWIYNRAIRLLSN